MKYRSRLWGFEVEAIQFSRDKPDYEAMRAFIGNALYKCPVCGGTGEYEDDGPKGCPPCNSRLIAIADPDTVKIYVDWGEWVTRNADHTKFVVYADEDFQRYFELV